MTGPRWALERGRDFAAAQTSVANAIVVLSAFYLFSLRYLHMTAFTLTGVKGTTAILMALAAVLSGQLAFADLPVMKRAFGSQPLTLAEGPVIIAAGAASLVVIEIEKRFLKRRFRDG